MVILSDTNSKYWYISSNLYLYTSSYYCDKIVLQINFKDTQKKMKSTHSKTLKVLRKTFIANLLIYYFYHNNNTIYLVICLKIKYN